MAKAKKMPSGNWTTRIFIGYDSNGKIKTKCFTAPSKNESEYLAMQYQVEHKVKSDSEILSSLIVDVVADYIKVKSNSLSPNTIRGYDTLLRNQIALFDVTRVNKLTTSVHQRWVDTIHRSHSAKTVKNADGLLVSALRYYNVRLDPITLPMKEYKPILVPTTKDVTTIVEYFKGVQNNEMVKAVYLAATGTLRRGEICALRVEDVDFENNSIIVRRSIALSKDGKFIEKTPKTYSSNRTIQLPDFVISLFPREGNVVNLNLHQISRMFSRAVTKLGLPHYTFHSLRHYSASIMHAQNIPTQYIMERGGWKSESTLNRIYRNSLDDWKKTFTDKTNDFFSNNFE